LLSRDMASVCINEAPVSARQDCRKVGPEQRTIVDDQDTNGRIAQ
jgi:hypothetical protein